MSKKHVPIANNTACLFQSLAEMGRCLGDEADSKLMVELWWPLDDRTDILQNFMKEDDIMDWGGWWFP